MRFQIEQSTFLLISIIASLGRSLDLRFANATTSPDLTNDTSSLSVDLPPPSPYSASLSGSASVTWLTGNTPNILNFNIHQDGGIYLSRYDEKSNKYINYNTIFGGADTDRMSAISATQYNEDTPEHKIHIFFSVGRQTRSGIWTESTKSWVHDDNFNSKGFQGNPRAAVSWVNADGTPSIRVYYMANLREDTSYGWQNEIRGLRLEQGTWSPDNDGAALKSFDQETASEDRDPFNNLAAVAWKDGSGPHIRIYFLRSVWHSRFGGGNWEHIFTELSKNSNGPWTYTEEWRDGNPTWQPLTAVSWDGPSGRQIRIYRHLRDRKAIREYSWSEWTDQWSDRELPKALTKDVDIEGQPSVIFWSTKDGAETHLRLYQYIIEPYPPPRKVAYYITEASYDSPNEWVAKTGFIYSFDEPVNGRFNQTEELTAS